MYSNCTQLYAHSFLQLRACWFFRLVSFCVCLCFLNRTSSLFFMSLCTILLLFSCQYQHNRLPAWKTLPDVYRAIILFVIPLSQPSIISLVGYEVRRIWRPERGSRGTCRYHISCNAKSWAATSAHWIAYASLYLTTFTSVWRWLMASRRVWRPFEQPS